MYLQQNIPQRSFALLCTAGIALLLLTGCSRVDIIYRTSDMLIEYYADDYLELDSAQLASWRPTLSAALAQHRQDELPYLARFFDTAYEGARKGFNRERVACMIDQFEDLYRRHVRIAVGLATPLLTDLTPAQINKLEAKFNEEAADEAKQDAAAEARRDRKRAKRYTEAMDWWLGSLSDAQHRITEEVTAAMPDTAASWETYRNVKREQLIAMLKRDANDRQLLQYLDNWLVEHRDISAELRLARLTIREQIIRLFMRMETSFSEQQRAHFAQRLASIRDDFMSLQRHPRMAPMRCASAS